MKRLISTWVLLAVCGATLTLPAVAVPAVQLPTPSLIQSADVPEVVSQRPFSEGARFMSLAGFYRYLTYEHTGIWLSRSEAVAAVHTQMEAAGR